MSCLSILEADLTRDDHQRAVRALTNAYAADPMGNAAALSEDVLDRVIAGLRAHPTARVFLAYVETQPVGIATCFTGFSTFAGQPVINIHDLAVLDGWRGQGVGRALLAAVEDAARSAGCARVTLEVGDANRRARRAYESAGFTQAHYGEAGHALFYVKQL